MSSPKTGKRILLSWLAGQDVDETEAKALGLPTSWVPFDETSTDASIQQQREEQALRAIRTIGILSTYYQPLILAFDQLEGLRDEHRLTQRWGDTVREIFTMTPNFLVITCIFPSLWESWFRPILDRSVTERIAQQTVTLETFAPRYGLKMLATHLESAFVKHRLPTNIYPFTEADVQSICFSATSPRSFIQNVRAAFQVWLDGEILELAGLVCPQPTEIVLQDSIDSLIATTLKTYEDEQRLSHENDIPLEQDFFGRIKSVIESLLTYTGKQVEYNRASCGTKVMPANLVVKSADSGKDVCIGVVNSGATAFAARMRNLNTVMRTRDNGMTPIVLRDSRCHTLGAKGKEYVEELERMGGSFLYVGSDESAILNAIYDTLVSIEEHDLSIGTHEVDKRQFVEYMRHQGTCRRSQLLRTASTCSQLFANAVGTTAPQAEAPGHCHESVGRNHAVVSEALAILPLAGDGRTVRDKTALNADVVIGDTDLDGQHLGIVGSLKHDNRRLSTAASAKGYDAYCVLIALANDFAPDVQGHVGYPEPGVVEHTTKLVEIDQLIVEEAVKTAVAEKVVVRETVEGESWLYLDCPISGRSRPRPISSPGCLGLPTSHAGHRHGKGHRLGRREAGNPTRCRAAGGDSAGVPAEDAGHYGRPRRRQDHPRPQHLGNFPGEEDEMRAGGPDRQGSQTHGGNDRPDGQDHPPALGIRSGHRRLQAKPAAPAHRRFVRAGRSFDGRCRPRPSIPAGRAIQRLRDPGGRRGPASFGRPWLCPGRSDCLRGWCRSSV